MDRGLLDQVSLERLLYPALDGSDNIVLVLEQSSDVPAVLTIASTNEAFCRVSGFAQADLIGRPFLSLTAPDTAPATGEAMLEAARQQRSYQSELLCSRRDGGSFWLGLHLMPVRERSTYCVLLGRDITEVRRGRRQQTAIQSLLAKVFVSARAAIVIVDESGIIQMANPAVDRLLGYPSGSLTGKVSMDLVAPASRAGAIAARQQQLETGQDYTIEGALQRADSSTISVELTSVMVRHEGMQRFRIITMTAMPSPNASPAIRAHVAGKFRLIGLEEVKEALGADWPEVSSRVMASAERVVQLCCKPGDTWSRTADCGFLICFDNATEAEAQIRAAALAREIRIGLIGEGELKSTAYVTAITARVELPSQPGLPPDMLAAAIGERLKARLTDIEGQARETLRQAIRTATCELAPVYNRQMREIVAHFATLPRALEHAVDSALVALPAKESQEFDYDRLVLGVAAAQMIDKLAVGSTLPIMVTVDFEVFLDRHRTECYVEAWQQLDRRLRSRLMLVLARVPRGAPRSCILECVARLHRCCRPVGLQAESMVLPPVEFTAFSATTVVVREGDLNAWGADDMAKLDQLITNVRAHRARVLVRQVSSRENAMRLLRLGIDLVALSEEPKRSV